MYGGNVKERTEWELGDIYEDSAGADTDAFNLDYGILIGIDIWVVNNIVGIRGSYYKGLVDAVEGQDDYTEFRNTGLGLAVLIKIG